MKFLIFFTNPMVQVKIKAVLFIAPSGGIVNRVLIYGAPRSHFLSFSPVFSRKLTVDFAFPA